MARPHTRSITPWTEFEDTLASAAYPKGRAEVMAAIPGRSYEAIRMRARKMGWSRPRRAVGRELLAALEDGPGSAEELAIEIDHTVNSVSARLVQMHADGILTRVAVPGQKVSKYVYSLRE